MPLAGRSGPPDPNSLLDQDGSPPVNTVQSVLDQQPYIEDTFVNKTAFNPETYADQFKLIQRYASGSRIQVTYFLTSTPIAGLQRADSIDQSNLRNPIRTSYTQINNFEIVMQGGLKSSFDNDSKESKLVGEALIYPGMRPRMGDEFVTPIGDSTFGIFRVTSVERLVYRQGSNHKITFFLSRYATDADISILKQSVTETVWFDKETYLGDATTLLRTESYNHLKALRQIRTILIRYYYNTFYNKSMTSIIAPNGTYDPYLVNYLNSKISITESIYRPQQLYPSFQNYENSIWSRLTDVVNSFLIGVQPNYNIVLYQATRWDVMISTLINKNMVALPNPNRQAVAAYEATLNPDPLPEPTPPVIEFGIAPWSQPLVYVATLDGYVLSTNFYTGNRTAMTPFEGLVYTVLYTRKIQDIGDFISSYLNTYVQLTYDEQYYFIPLYIWLIDVGISQISAPSTFMT